jgi:hypothetical protein
LKTPKRFQNSQNPIICQAGEARYSEKAPAAERYIFLAFFEAGKRQPRKML